MVQNDKKFCQSHFISQEPDIIWLSFMVQMCKRIISAGFFHFFKILIFQVVRQVKGQKTVQNDKKFRLLCSISQEPYIIWLSFMVQMCKMIISPGVFFRFWNFDFFNCQGAERAKYGRKWQKVLFVTRYISGAIYHMIFIYGTHVCIKG